MSDNYVTVPIDLWRHVRNVPSDRLPTAIWDAIQAVPVCICTTAGDLGFSGWGDGISPNTIAHRHPECLEHGRVTDG